MSVFNKSMRVSQAKYRLICDVWSWVVVELSWVGCWVAGAAAAVVGSYGITRVIENHSVA